MLQKSQKGLVQKDPEIFSMVLHASAPRIERRVDVFISLFNGKYAPLHVLINHLYFWPDLIEARRCCYSRWYINENWRGKS